MTSRLEDLEAKRSDGYKHGKIDLERSREKCERDPASINDLDLALAEYFIGKGAVNDLIERRAKALNPAPASPPVQPSPQQRTLPAPGGFQEGDDIDIWTERNKQCAAPVGYVNAVFDIFLKHWKELKACNRERHDHIAVLEARVQELEARREFKYCGVWEARMSTTSTAR